jgi:hypothetical protein
MDNSVLNLNDPKLCKFGKCLKLFSCFKIPFSQFG